MKNFRLLFAVGLFAVMGLVLIAEERQGGGAKNVPVLGAAPIPETMQSFVQALGLLDKGTCTFCHAEDRSSDEKETETDRLNACGVTPAESAVSDNTPRPCTPGECACV